MKTNHTLRRNEAFVACALRILSVYNSCGRHIDREKLLREALASQPPSYFVDFDRASGVLRTLMGRPVPAKPSMRQRMWLEMLQQVRNVMATRNLPFHKSLAFVLNYRRPSRYWLARATAERLLRGHIATGQHLVRC